MRGRLVTGPGGGGAGAGEAVLARALSAERALAWVVVLRWHAVGGQVAAALAARYALGVEVSAGVTAAIVGAAAASNVALGRRAWGGGRGARGAIVAALAADVAGLTALLFLAGGASNPFASLYLVEVLVAALALPPRGALLVLALACAGRAALVAAPPPPGPAGDGPWRAWLAFALAAVAVAAVVARFAAAAREQRAALDRADERAARARAIASLGALAAGAAHELNTPLGTIAVASNELGLLVETDPERAVEDAALIRDEVERCRAIVQRMAARAGGGASERPARTTLARVFGDASAALPAGEARRVAWRSDVVGEVVVPAEGLTQALAALVGNALHATRGAGGAVAVTASPSAGGLCFTVADDGPGIDPSVRDRLGEPFVTTKPPGQGTGLGVFLCRAFADAWRGELAFGDRPGGGTVARLELPHPAAGPAGVAP